MSTMELFPRFSSDGPYIAIRNQMAKELIQHINWYIERGDKVSQPEKYHQMIVDFTRALVRIAKLDNNWHIINREL
jgi:hypothetical protein